MNILLYVQNENILFRIFLLVGMLDDLHYLLVADVFHNQFKG